MLPIYACISTPNIKLSLNYNNKDRNQQSYTCYEKKSKQAATSQAFDL